ncbi:MAG TPA: hypothetical protein VHY30_00705 [Verrucomicrobiae bacterium]|nr:hypothetical protein [Verrucomicrobiae bacterium]
MNPDRMRRNLAGTIFNAAWFSRLLAGRRGGCQALLWAAVVNLVLFSVFLTYATPVYETNDDLMMQMIASGFYTGHPDAHLVFTNILIGWTLKFFYGVSADCNWYFIYLLAVHYAALTAIAFLIISRRGGWLFTSLYLGFFLVVEMRILLHLQFTTTAFLVGTAGLLLLVDGLQAGHQVHWPKVIAGIAFAGLMCLIREPIALLLAVIACPFVLERLGLSQWHRLLGTGLACAGIFLVLHGINRWAYQRDPAWNGFLEYNHMRGEIQVTPLAKFIPKAAPAVGWSENDGWMFSEFYFSDPDVYAGVPKMRLFLDKLKSLARNEPASPWKFSEGIMFLPKIFWGDAVFGDAGTLMNLAVSNAMWCLLAAGAFRRRCATTLLTSYGLFMMFNFYLLTTARLPERVAYNFPLFINAICLYWASGFRNLPGAITWPTRLGIFFAPLCRTKTSWLATLVLIPVWAILYLFSLSELAQSLWSANAFNRNLEHISHKILQPVRTLSPDHRTPLLIAMPFDSVLEQCLFFYPPAQKVPFSLVPYGWITHSPLFNQILERHHLRPYSLSLVDRPEVFFLMKPRWLGPLRIFYREHYGLDIRFDTVLNTDEIPQFKDCQLHLYQAHTVGNNLVEKVP